MSTSMNAFEIIDSRYCDLYMLPKSTVCAEAGSAASRHLGM